MVRVSIKLSLVVLSKPGWHLIAHLEEVLESKEFVKVNTIHFQKPNLVLKRVNKVSNKLLTKVN